MDVLIAYDINVERHKELKEKLKESGFLEKWKDSNYVEHKLPDTTVLIQRVIYPSQAKKLFLDAIEELNKGEPEDNQIKTTKCIIAQVSNLLSVPCKEDS